MYYSIVRTRTGTVTVPLRRTPPPRARACSRAALPILSGLAGSGSPTHLFWEQVTLAVSWRVFAQPKDPETFSHGLVDYLGQRILCVSAKLARMRVVTVRHCRVVVVSLLPRVCMRAPTQIRLRGTEHFEQV